MKPERRGFRRVSKRVQLGVGYAVTSSRSFHGVVKRDGGGWGAIAQELRRDTLPAGRRTWVETVLLGGCECTTKGLERGCGNSQEPLAWGSWVVSWVWSVAPRVAHRCAPDQMGVSGLGVGDADTRNATHFPAAGGVSGGVGDADTCNATHSACE